MTEHFRVSEWQILEWERDYAPLDVRREIVQMNHWLDANPRKAKKKLWKKFVTGWLRREYAKVAHAQVQARIGSRVGAYKDVRQSQAIYSAADRAYYEKFYREHPDLKPSWWEDSDGKSEPMQKSLGVS